MTSDHARVLSVRRRASVETVDGLVPAYLAAARGSMHADTVAELKNCLELYE
jgi:hypothetical protein